MPFQRARITLRHPAALPLLVAALLFSPTGTARALDSRQCVECHGGRIDPGAYKASVHGYLSCTACHADIKVLPHPAPAAPADCSGCHAEAAHAHARSRHAISFSGTPLRNPLSCAGCHGAHDIVRTSDPASPVHYRRVAATCTRCHGDAEVTGTRNIGIPGAARMYSRSVHNRAVVEKGLAGSATCVDCHGAHDIRDRRDPSSNVYKENVPGTCGRCHYEAYTFYRDSVHGAALNRGVPDAPNCAGCHGEHDVRPVEDPAAGGLSVSAASCPSCHAAEKLAERYGVPVDKVRGYERSFHGLSARLGDRTVAYCASCHGDHAIFPSRDPRSTVHPKNLPVTCGKCHPGATAYFADGNVHVGPGGAGGAVKHWVERIYIWLIVLVIGGMVLHNAFDFFRKMQAIRRERRESSAPAYERMNLFERVQHLLLLVTFFVLAYTGFALKFNWPFPLVSGEAGVALRGLVHRIAAVVMTAIGICHVAYAAFTPRGRGQLRRMAPRRKDAEDIAGTVRYFLGRAGSKPAFGRFSYVQKVEYLALVWGTVVMAVTGLLLWFEEEALRIMPLWGLEVAGIVHYYEAVLAVLAVIVWHFYQVFVTPECYPMSFSWIDGKLTRREMEREHALELEEIDAYERDGNAPPPDVTRIVGKAERRS